MSTGASNKNECSLGITGAVSDGGPVCVGPNIIVQLDESMGLGHNARTTVKSSDDPTAAKVINDGMKATGCDSQRCLIKTAISKGWIHDESVVELLFKRKGPAKSTALLTNFDIDGVCGQLMNNGKFTGYYHMEMQMMDFWGSSTHKPSELANIHLARDVIERGYNCMGVVINTDTRDGKGEHWFCIFCDFRTAGTATNPYTIEYFNSSGNKPMEPVARWLRKAEVDINTYTFGSEPKKRTAVISPISTLQHQYSQTECGPYAIYYIYCRLSGRSQSDMHNKRIVDQQMTRFRGDLFAA